MNVNNSDVITYLGNHQNKNSLFNKSVRQIERNQPTIQNVDGENVLRVKDSNIVAVPQYINNMNSKNWIIVNIITKEKVAYLTKREVRGWLTKNFINNCL